MTSRRSFSPLKSFEDGDCFCDYDGKVTLETSRGDTITVPLSAQQRARWCVIAKIDNMNESQPRLINVNAVQGDEPELCLLPQYVRE